MWKGREVSRRAFRVILFIVSVLLVNGSEEVFAQQSLGIGKGVCQRTQQVRDAIVTASGVATCSDVTLRHIREITSLDLSNSSISSLSVGDFDGLVRLKTLDLSNNSLSSLPDGLFDGLYLLELLRLDNNQLDAVSARDFDGLLRLKKLTLHGNGNEVLPDAVFGDFSPFAGMGRDGSQSANPGRLSHIERFLDTHDIMSVEEFIEALPPLHKERFVVIYESEALASEHVSYTHPRVISFGGDGRFIFSWLTDRSAPAPFVSSVEFLQKQEKQWVAGVIDFSDDTPEVSEPESCQSCHGSLNKPLWGELDYWTGTEFAYNYKEDYQTMLDAMDALKASINTRIEPLDFSTSDFAWGNTQRRFITPGEEPYVLVVIEAGALMAWRHSQILFEILKDRREDFDKLTQKFTCSKLSRAEKMFSSLFSQIEHNLFVKATVDPKLIENGTFDHPNDHVRISYYYQYGENILHDINFLALVHLWSEQPIIRKLYRETPRDGGLTAEDEIIDMIRLHFGRGHRAALRERARKNKEVEFSHWSNPKCAILGYTCQTNAVSGMRHTEKH